MMLSVLLSLLTLVGCLGDSGPAPLPSSPLPLAPVQTGAQRLVTSDFAALAEITPARAPRVGLVTNHTARVDTSDGGPAHLIDRMLMSEAVELAALFGPEHGIRGDAEAGARVDDDASSVPIYSLYGSNKKPTRAQTRGLDVLVFDMQDIGARFYTYISTMGYAMQAAAEAGIPFVVLDRPNPIGDRVEGWTLEPEHESFVGLYPIPVTHGLTVGELARMIQGEGWLNGLANLDLQVIEMEGYTRTMAWEDTGLPWVAPSPNIPDVETARIYPGAAFFEGTTASEGRGTLEPFKLVGAIGANAEAIATDLNGRGLAGVRFEAEDFVPRDLPGQATNPKGEGETVAGIRTVVTDASSFEPVVVGVHVLDAVYRDARSTRSFFKPDWLAKLAGTRQFHAALRRGDAPEAIIASWAEDASAFRQLAESYRLYE
ncbi:MAG: DUF1343 domain-containing protein [Rubricoccaceae bacterium]